MKFRIGNRKNILIFALLITAVAALLLPAQSVMASPGVGSSAQPTTPVVGGTANVGADGSANEQYNDLKYRVYDEMTAAQGAAALLISDPTPGTPGSCSFNAHPVGGGRSWDLWSTGAGAPALIDMGAPSELGLMRFGDSATTAVAEIANFGPNTAFDAASTPNIVWKLTGGALNDDKIDLFSPVLFWVIAVCGDQLDNNGVFFATTISRALFHTQNPVAGEILPIDTTALLIAGITSSPMWILPALGVAAGVAVALLKFQVRKQD